VAGLKKAAEEKRLLDAKLLKAVDSGNASQIMALILKGADVNGKRFNLPQGNLLDKVIKKGNRAVVQAFIEAGSYLENGLVRSLEVGDHEITELFLNRSAGMRFKNINGENALMLAAKNGNPSMVAKILAKSSQVNEMDNNGRNALTLAIVGIGMPPTPERVEIVKMLLEKNIDFSAKDSFNQTALDYVDSFRKSPKRSHKKIKKMLKKAKKVSRRRG
jgi:serine/threonine-protein phosphatase 6 regulatory ankyrin repeat subunit B